MDNYSFRHPGYTPAGQQTDTWVLVSLTYQGT